MRRALAAGDVIEVLVTDVETPDAGVPWQPHLAEPPDADPTRFPLALEVSRNGAVLDVLRITPEHRVVAVIVTWSLGAKTNPTMGEYVHLEYKTADGPYFCGGLMDGDIVRVRALAGSGPPDQDEFITGPDAGIRRREEGSGRPDRSLSRL